jgi:prephenate dehydrogenase
MTPPVVAIVGLGLIGGSLARALTRAGWRVIGVDRAAVARRARAARAVAETRSDPEDAARRAQVVVLAAPPRVNLTLLHRLARAAPGAVVTDVGSVKRPICRLAARLRLTRFVGGHPMAGSAGSGFAASSPDLFRGRVWILTPAPARRPPAILLRLIRAAGARAVQIPPASHDRAVAALSHVPQLVSWALLGAARADAVTRRHLHVAGPGFRDMTRLARSPRGLWRQILTENRVEVARALRIFVRSLGREARHSLANVLSDPLERNTR